MKKISFLFLALTGILLVHAQNSPKPRLLKKTVQCQMPLTADDDMPGTRGASITWHPVLKKYYAAMAGNAAYPMAVFDAAGKRVSDENLKTGFDTRGLWYNPEKKQIEGNGYNETGWFYYKTDAKGAITGSDTIATGMWQPDAQKVGAYLPASREVIFISELSIARYKYADRTTDPEKDIHLQLGNTKKDGPVNEDDLAALMENYNNTSVVYTGISGAEIGLLNTYSNKVELYDIKSGFLTQVLDLPDGILGESSFNFAYANGMFWFFNMDERIWYGCK